MKSNWPTNPSSRAKLTTGHKKLGEVLELCDSGTWGDESPTGMPLLRSTNMQNGELVLSDVKYIHVPKEKVERYILREGDILITKSSGSVDHIGKSLFITKEMDGKYGFSNFTQRLRVDKDQVLPKWVYLKISNPATRDFLLGASQTTTGLRNLKIPALKELEIPLPPLEVQKKIVAKLEGVLAKISEAKKLRAEARENADNLLPAELHKIFEEGKKRGWDVDTLASICLTFTDGDWIESKDQSSDGIRLVQTGNVGNGEFLNKIGRSRFISVATFERLGCTEIFPNDLLISRLPDPVGRSCLIPETGQRMITAVDCTIVRTNTKRASQKYFMYFTSSPDYFGQVLRLISGTTRDRISRKNLGTIKIPLPPLAEQKRIVKHLDSLSQKLQKLQEYQKSTQSDLLTFEQAILQKAFL